MQALGNIGVIALATSLEGIRHRVLWAIVCIAAILTMANLAITTLYSWDLGKVAVEFGLSAVAFTGLLLVFFLGIKILGDDIERSHIFMLISRPVTIRQYIAGKYCGLALVLGACTIIIGFASALSVQYILWCYPEYVPPGFSWLTYCMAMFCQWLSLIVVLAVSVLWFSFASQSFMALLLTVCSYMVGQNMELLRRIVVENPQAGILTGQDKLVVALSWIFPNLSFFDKKYTAAYGLSFGYAEFLLLTGYAISYSVLLVIIAAYCYERKELV